MNYKIRLAENNDIAHITRLALSLWPDNQYEALEREMATLLLDKNAALFLMFEEEQAIGFSQCQLRFDYVEGTESSPVGYLEGIYVEEKYRHQGAAAELLKSCEIWAKEQGCIEFASDCELDNSISLKFHLKMGFTEANRIICFQKKL